jgi:hypothetical protein
MSASRKKKGICEERDGKGGFVRAIGQGIDGNDGESDGKT